MTQEQLTNVDKGPTLIRLMRERYRVLTGCARAFKRTPKGARNYKRDWALADQYTMTASELRCLLADINEKESIPADINEKESV